MINLANSQFVKSCASKKDFLTDKKQVVFLGRSNVGKSSLINALTNNKKLVYVSSTPGRTKLISYFSIGELAYLVDAPGYGYFKDGSLDFEDMILDYFSLGPKYIKRVYLLLDSRRELTDDDKKAIELISSYGLKIRFVFTKLDKLNMSEKAKLMKRIEDNFPDISIYLTSSSKKIGLDKIISDINAAIKERD